METPPLPDPSNPDNLTPPQLAQTAEQLQLAIKASSEKGNAVEYVDLLKQYCEHRLLTLNSKSFK